MRFREAITPPQSVRDSAVKKDSADYPILSLPTYSPKSQIAVPDDVLPFCAAKDSSRALISDRCRGLLRSI